MAGQIMSKGDVRYLVREILECDRAIKAGNRDRYMIGRRNAYASAAAQLMRIDRESLNRYMDWAHDRVVHEGVRLVNLEDPFSWIRRGSSE
jgi:hypothetical protein